MDPINETQNPKASVNKAVHQILDEGKKLANELYEEGCSKASEVEENLKKCSEDLSKKVQENPLTSILIAGGVGFLLSKLLKK